jgi:hypothetical protein
LRAQAALVHATGLSLEQLGVSQLPANTRLSFKHLNSQLSPSGTPPLFAFRTTPLSITEMIAAPTGVFVAIAYHGYDEDVEAVDSNFVRDRFAQGIELPKHFVTFNLDTNVVVTYPEVCQQPIETLLILAARLLHATPQVVFIKAKEKLEPSLLLDRLRLPPYQLAFDTSRTSSSDIRQLFLKVVPDALRTAFNTPAELERLINKQ